MADTLDVLERSTQKTHEWLNDFVAELGADGDEREAYRLLRGFLHTLRDRLTVGEAVDLAAQLPVFLRGVYYDGWVPDRVPQTYDDVDTFLRRISEHGQIGDRDPREVARAGGRLLARHISVGEFGDLLAQLPPGVKDLLRQ